jgi:uncharacterized protein (DUF58 family)
MDLSELLKTARLLALRVRREVDAGLGGAYASRRRGSGLEFEELREFIDGDDARFIHWPATLSQGRPFVKRYREEHELDMLVCLDVSKSMTSTPSAWRTATEVAALMAGCASYDGDAVGLLMHSTATESWLPPRRGERQLLRMIREIVGVQPVEYRTNLDGMLRATANVLKRHSRVVVISDWLGDSSASPLRSLAFRHDVVICHVVTDAVKRIPPAGWLETEDAETGERLLVDWTDDKTRSEITERQDVAAKDLRVRSHGAKADYLLFDGHESSVQVIRHWLAG